MPLDLYWDGDCTAVRWYRDKYKTDLEEENTRMWLQTRYIYDTLIRVSPLYRAFVKHPKPEPYLEEPYNIGIKNSEEEMEQAKNEEKQRRGLEYFKSLVEGINKHITKEGGEDSSDGD